MHYLRILQAAALLLLFFAIGCGTEPRFRSFDASVISPHGAEGAVVLELEGAYFGVTAPTGSQLFTHAARGITRVVVVLDSPGDVRFTLTLDDLGKAPDAQIIEVADGANELRATLRGYRVEFVGVEP